MKAQKLFLAMLIVAFTFSLVATVVALGVASLILAKRLLPKIRERFHSSCQLSAFVVNVRRDTANGLPYGYVHSAGISSIVWGCAPPSTTLVITLTRSGSLVVTRTVTTDKAGSFIVSMDRLIEDGDTIEVFDGSKLKTVQVPIIAFQADPVRKLITGTAPANIKTTSGGPHSLEISIGGHTYPITTTATGAFTVTLNANPYLAGLLGSFRYVTPDGDRVYKPIFIADSLVRGKPGDWRADVILGQPDFSQITFNEVVGNRLFNPGGVYVDRSVRPNRVYVYDAGNNRVLGLSHLGICLAGARQGQPCTTNSDCPGSVCKIQEDKAADIVLGQPSFNTSACNGDSGYQLYPDVPMAGADTLCTLPEEAVSVSEAGSAVTMATDSQGNLYVPDFFNNRILRYNNPFTTDTVADYVWGQADFSGTTCNRGAGFDRTDARSLCLTPPPGFGELFAGVAIDSAGNLWVADTHNNRVLRFPYVPSLGAPAPEADLVLGQPDFTSVGEGKGFHQMNKPASVRVDDTGTVYVADYLNRRVLVFKPPLYNSMPASYVLGEGKLAPTGLELDPKGGLWVNDDLRNRFVYFVDGVIRKVVPAGESRAWGGIGVDSDSNLLTAGWDLQQGIRLAAPAYVQGANFLRAQSPGLFNQTGPCGLNGGIGLEVTANQLIYSDGSRLLFWNAPWSLTDYQPADGVVAAPDFQKREKWGPYFGRMRADSQGRLWVLSGTLWQPNVIYGYQLPLTTGATPIFTITSPLPLLGGGVFTWSNSLYLGGIEVQPECDCLWLSDEDNHRVFRIRNVSTKPTVDIVLGQLDPSGMQCNQGRGRDAPSRDSLCYPGGLAFDRAGNLYVSDHNLEIDGNHRLLEFDANLFPDAPTSAIFGIPATRVFGRNGDFTKPNCLPREQDPLCAPFEPAFDSQGRMVIGFNAYLGPRFPMVYQNPLTNPLPIAVLADFHSMPVSARFDQFDNLYVIDHNRNRILIYRRP
jgi:sugar lactone lactonase YvrE